MVSTGYSNAQRNAHPYQYLKEAYGLSTSPTNMGPNENDWPSLNTAMFGEDRQNIGRRPMNPSLPTNQQQMNRRPNSIVRMPPQMGLQQMNVTQQQMQQQKQAQQAINNGAAKNPKLYKTELCRSWADSGHCNYGERCQYAHGALEKRPVPRHPKYKTEACQSYHQSGYCAYGARCHFVHNESEQLLEQMIAANNNATAQKQQIGQMQHQPPIRPNNLFNGNPVANSPTFNSQRGTPVNMTPNGVNPIARVYNQTPSYFNQQFPSQLQIFNDGLKSPPTSAGNATPTQLTGFEMNGSTGESPIPSSNDSGSESPICSFSPGSAELEDPAFFFVRKQLEATKISGPPKLQTAPLNLLPSSLNSDFESGFSSSSSTSSNGGTKSLNSPIVGSPPAVSSTMWSNGGVGTPTSAAGVGRLPVFERLSNNL